MINPFELEKTRDLCFAANPADQVERAQMILSGMPNLKVTRTHKPHTLQIQYNLKDYMLEGLERALEHEGFHLDHSFLHNVGRNIIYYCEDTTRHNMEIRDHVTKKNEKDVFVGLSGHHLQAAQAGKPLELREYE
jgi:hypothetical protein